MTADTKTGTAAGIGRKRHWQRRTLTEKDIGRKEIGMI